MIRGIFSTGTLVSILISITRDLPRMGHDGRAARNNQHPNQHPLGPIIVYVGSHGRDKSDAYFVREAHKYRDGDGT